ncbi:hypothetical protein SAMN04488554_1194 [Ruania alba]|uniref:Uncharacterized protein n=1 Tax=Ruania alba TaxID=648782 RepID=A0A1H5F1D5_9MICO|nr:hypothetical protein SAMN04488554_1194 [Ruania alba]
METMAATGDYDSTGAPQHADSAEESDSLEGHRPWPDGVSPGPPVLSPSGEPEQARR